MKCPGKKQARASACICIPPPLITLHALAYGIPYRGRGSCVGTEGFCLFLWINKEAGTECCARHYRRDRDEAGRLFKKYSVYLQKFMT